MGRHKARRPSPKQFRAIAMAKPRGHRARHSTCARTGKIRYSTKQLALNSTSNMKGLKRPYRCSHCKGWHITSTEYNPKHG